MIKKASDETDNVLCEYTEDEKSTITHIGFRTIPGAAPRFQECHPGYFPQYLNESIEADDGIYWVPTSGRDEQVVRINKDQIVYDSNMQRSVIRQDTVNNKLKDNRMSNFKSKTKKASDDEMELLLDGSRGVYIPKNFVECYSPEEWHLSPEIAEILAKDPEGNDYWEAWDEVLNTAFYEKDGKKYTLYQGESGDLFAVPEGYDWDRYSSSKRSKIKKASDKPIVIYYNPETLDMRGKGVEKVVVDGEVYKGVAGLEALLEALGIDNPEFYEYQQHIYFDGNSAGAFLNLDGSQRTEDSEAAYKKVSEWIGNNVSMKPISEFKEEPEDDHMAGSKSKTKSAKREILYLNSRTAALTVGSDFDCTEDAAKKIASEIGQLDNVERYHMSGDKLVFSFAKEIEEG